MAALSQMTPDEREEVLEQLGEMFVEDREQAEDGGDVGAEPADGFDGE